MGGNGSQLQTEERRRGRILGGHDVVIRLDPNCAALVWCRNSSGYAWRRLIRNRCRPKKKENMDNVEKILQRSWTGKLKGGKKSHEKGVRDIEREEFEDGGFHGTKRRMEESPKEDVGGKRSTA